MSKTWEVINDLLGKIRKCQYPNQFLKDKNKLTDRQLIVN